LQQKYGDLVLCGTLPGNIFFISYYVIFSVNSNAYITQLKQLSHDSSIQTTALFNLQKLIHFFFNSFLRCKLEYNQNSFTLLDIVLVHTWLPTQDKQYTEISNTDWAELPVSNHMPINISFYCIQNTNRNHHHLIFLPDLTVLQQDLYYSVLPRALHICINSSLGLSFILSLIWSLANP
jgi:hypothetical protein